MYVIAFLIGIITLCATFHVVFTKKEGMVQEGSCDCCKCGWTSCDLCAKNRETCCGNSMGFDRYTFEPAEANFLAPYYMHVKNQQSSTKK